MSSTTTSIALAAAVAAGQTANLLSPSGVVGAAVSDILAAADDVGAIINTANAVLSDFVSTTNDPIQSSFSQGQPYSGTFITSPTVTLIPLSTSSQSLASSTAAVALLSCEQLAALVARVGYDIENDVELASALAFLFEELANIRSIGFSISLDDDCLCGCVEVTPFTYPASDNTVTYSIPSITANPNVSNLTAFVSTISGSFPNTPGISGVAASVWVDGLSISSSSTGTTISGIPQTINSGVYSDITTQTTEFVPSFTPVTIVDYSYQQNLLNTVLALAIDNGLIPTVTSLLTSPMVTPVTYQVISNRLGSVAARGDTGLLIALIEALGSDNVPNELSLIGSLLAALFPSDVLNALSSSNAALNTVFYSGGIQITTNTNSKTLAAIIADIETILSLLGITIQEVFSINTCNSIFCSNSLLNVSMMNAANQYVLEALLGTSTVQMAKMFA